MAEPDRRAEALRHFKDWSSYLLVTTVAALGWAATSRFAAAPGLRVVCIWSLALSVVFGVLTLASIPLVAEQAKGEESIYTVSARFSVRPFSRRPASLRLKQTCVPQYVLFLIGIVTYAIGAARR